MRNQICHLHLSKSRKGCCDTLHLARKPRPDMTRFRHSPLRRFWFSASRLAILVTSSLWSPAGPAEELLLTLCNEERQYEGRRGRLTWIQRATCHLDRLAANRGKLTWGGGEKLREQQNKLYSSKRYKTKHKAWYPSDGNSAQRISFLYFLKGVSIIENKM